MTEHSFIEQALVYLAAAVIAVPLTKRLGLGAVIGFLAAGVAIGPWGLALISNPKTVLSFAEFGVVLLLFLVGLELDPRRLWQLRRPILGMGAVQVGATIFAVTAIGRAIGQPVLVALVAGMGFAMSSTAIALATLEEENLLPTPGGQASFSVLLFQDLAVIPLMIVLALLAPGADAGSFGWSDAGKALGLITLLIAAGHFALRPVLRFIAGTGLREIFIAFALLLVIGIALLMETVGLSMSLGAFLAGVLLADSEYRHELELDIEPFKGLLLGLFFIAVGMSVDLGLLVRAPLVVLGLACAVVALKMVLLYFISYSFGYCGRTDSTLFALALSQVGEFAFVLFALAGTERLLPRQTVDVLNAVVAASMLATPLLMTLWERIVAPRLERAPERAPDAIAERNAVIVAGFGRFGQIVARVLRALGIEATLIDHDPNQIDTVRRFGWKAYYGDATHIDVLAAAGAARARLLVLAIDDAEATMRTVKLVRSRFPELQILARAHSRTDAYEYAELGVPAVRETFGSAIYTAERALVMLGRDADDAHRIARRFRDHDEALIAQLASHRGDVKRLIALSEKGRDDLEQLLADEVAHPVEQPAGVANRAQS